MGYGGSFFQSNTPPTISPSQLARNGDTVDGTGAVVLGQDVGAAGNPAVFLNDREIPNGGFNLKISGGGNTLLTANNTADTGQLLQVDRGVRMINGFGGVIQMDSAPAAPLLLQVTNSFVFLNGNNSSIVIGQQNIDINATSPNPGAGNVNFNVFGGITVMRVMPNGHVLIGSLVDNGEVLQVTGGISQNQATALIHAITAMNDGAAAGVGTLTNAPVNGNPTKWIPFDDAGTTRFIPSW